MAINRLYQDELSYLRELGAIFAAENPQIAPFLAREADDPDVERLLEGFAFLIAKLREKLDDELPEVVQNLLRIIWPHYLRPIPPMTMIGFRALPTLAASVSIPKGAVVQSRRTEAGVACPFRTCFDVDLMPLAISEASFENRPSSARIQISFSAMTASGLVSLGSNRIRLLLGSEREPQIGSQLYLWLLRHTRSIAAKVGTRQLQLGPDAISAVGFDRTDAVIPYPSNGFHGFRIIQEYLHWPARFLFVDLAGLAPLASAAEREMTLTFETTRPLPEGFRLSANHVRLNCTPALNLFEHDGVPTHVDHRRSEYRIMPLGNSAAFSVNHVIEAEGYRQGSGERRRYLPFESFEHALSHGQRLSLRTRLQPSIVGRGVDVFATFYDGNDPGLMREQETITPKLLCTNGPIVDQLPIGSIDQTGTGVPVGVAAGNVSPVLAEVMPPIGNELLWRLVANLARNYASFVDVRALRGMISAYDFRAVYDSAAARRVELITEALTACKTEPLDFFVRGLPVRGRRIVVEALDSRLGGIGELFLFGSVLDAFFSTYASVNSLHVFAMRGADTNTEFQWAPRMGTTAPF
jgi:type VI secretion system protein ImpG